MAITRRVSPRIGECELTHLARTPIDFARAQEQHLAYERCLETLGCDVLSLPAEPDLPDSVFVEDAAVIFAELALITRPGAESRRAETTSIAEALRPYRALRFIKPPATLDGGDVLRLGRRVLVGLSSRTNSLAVEQMRANLGPIGYTVEGVQVHGCLHLKSAATEVADNTVLLNAAWIERGIFLGMDVVETAPGEPFAANALRVRDVVLYPSTFSETRRRLEQRGIGVMTVDASELAKAEGGVTCCSLVVEVRGA